MTEAKGGQTGQGYNFDGEKVQGMAARLKRYEDENKRRRPCRRCGNLVMPDKLAEHNAAYHQGSWR